MTYNFDTGRYDPDEPRTVVDDEIREAERNLAVLYARQAELRLAHVQTTTITTFEDGWLYAPRHTPQFLIERGVGVLLCERRRGGWQGKPHESSGSWNSGYGWLRPVNDPEAKAVERISIHHQQPETWLRRVLPVEIKHVLGEVWT